VMSAWKTLLSLESYKADDIRSNISKLRLEISNVAEQIKKLEELIFDYHQIASFTEGQRLDSYKIYQTFNLISQLESGRSQLYLTQGKLHNQLRQSESRLASAEREKLKYRKLQSKADNLVKVKALSKDQMEMDDIALRRFKKIS
jgi:flagellar export protein FliJ